MIPSGARCSSSAVSWIVAVPKDSVWRPGPSTETAGRSSLSPVHRNHHFFRHAPGGGHEVFVAGAPRERGFAPISFFGHEIGAAIFSNDTKFRYVGEFHGVAEFFFGKHLALHDAQSAIVGIDQHRQTSQEPAVEL